MVSVFRRMLERKPLRIIVYLASFLVVFPTAFILMVNRFFDTAQWVVKVNGSSVHVDTYQERVTRVREQVERLRQMFGPGVEQLLEAQGMTNPEKMALDSLILQKIVQQAADSVPVMMSPAYVQAHLAKSLPRELINPDGDVDRVMFQQQYRMPYEQFVDQQSEEMLHALVGQLAIAAAYVPNFMVRDQFVRKYAKHQYSVVTVPVKASAGTLTPEEIRNFYVQQNRDTKRYMVPEKRSGSVWTFTPALYGIQVGDEQIKRYYEQNKHRGTEFEAQPMTMQARVISMPTTAANREQVRAKLIALRQELAAHPDQFEKKGAKLVSFSAGKAAEGPAFEESISRLPKDGEITQIIEGKDALMIAQRVSKKPRTFKPLEQVKSLISQRLRDERFKKTFLFEARRAIHEAQQDEKNTAVTDFVARKHGAMKAFALTEQTKDQATERLFGVRKDGYGAFMDGETGIIVHTVQVEKANYPQFEAIKGRVEADLRAERARKAARAQAESILKASSFADAVAKAGLTAQATDWISANDEKQAKETLKKFPVPATVFTALGLAGQAAIHDTAGAVYIVRVDKVAPFDEAEFKKHEGEITTQVGNEQQALVQQGFIDCLLSHATLKKNTDKRTNPVDVGDYDIDG